MVATAGTEDSPVSLVEHPGSGGPTVLRILLGAQLRRLRESKRISLEEAGNVIRASHSKISRLETGRVGFKDRDIADLLTFYGVTDELARSRFLDLAGQSKRMDWWTSYSDVLPGWFENYLGLETVSPVETERRVGLRVKRQDLLTRASPPRIWSVMDEAVLRRPVGGAAVMRAQLRHLVEAAKAQEVTFQVVPFARGGHAGASGSFTILRFDELYLPDVVYIEQLTGAIYLEQRSDVEHYLAVMDQLSTDALPPAASIRFIEQVAAET